ncbi:MAG: 1,4-dihydroxy-2-naphthoate octaprenyltransferase [Candidatus Omnitrophica bacterium]|nr:1,4-dihydroxy-2-naphthoate octaprenyltransferase [Candidatus Omnitrophota bacterium]
MSTERVFAWLRTLRLPFLTATIIPVAVGTAVGWHESGRCDWLSFWLTLCGISFLHIGTNLVNDYFDHLSSNDWVNPSPTPFSGGSRTIQEGFVAGHAVLRASFFFFILGSLIGLYLNWRVPGNAVLLFGVIGVFCGYFYTADPLRIGYRGFGELLVGLCFGPLVVMGSYVVQTGHLGFIPFLASVPVSILIVLVLYINEFPDYEADKKTGKKTAVVCLGRERAIKLYHGLLGALYLYMIACVLFGLLPLTTAVTLLTAPLGIMAALISRRAYARTPELLPVNALTAALHFSFGALLTAGFILDKILFT